MDTGELEGGAHNFISLGAPKGHSLALEAFYYFCFQNIHIK
jgi:hypothetical protein